MLKRILTLSLVFTFVLGLAGFALAQNQAYVTQVGAPNNSSVQQTGSSNLVNSTQIATWANDLDVNQSGASNTVWLDQSTGLGNNAAPVPAGSITQTGSGNIVVGAIVGPPALVNSAAAAIQTTVSGNNVLDVDQTNNLNQVGLYQQAVTGNTADIDQLGSDIAAVYQVTVGGANSAIVAQSGGNVARVSQDAVTGNTAGITQTGSGNGAAVYQSSGGGSNSVTVTQNGGDVASVSQSGIGNNIAVISQ